jgi:hypothetical protein
MVDSQGKQVDVIVQVAQWNRVVGQVRNLADGEMVCDATASLWLAEATSVG